MSNFVLILWITYLNSGSAVQDGALLQVPFHREAPCLEALAAIKARAKYVDGICVNTR